jgi:hypothetical protein
MTISLDGMMSTYMTSAPRWFLMFWPTINNYWITIWTISIFNISSIEIIFLKISLFSTLIIEWFMWILINYWTNEDLIIGFRSQNWIYWSFNNWILEFYTTININQFMNIE